MSVQAEPSEWGNLGNFAAIVNTLRSVFSIVRPYQIHMPSFFGLWGFATASESLDPRELGPREINARISAGISKNLGSYDGLTHQAIFAIPKHIRTKLAASRRIITDKQPISAY
jgi:spermidine synthase